ncbi:MAG: hypothetical protein MZV70_49220 [Desulfobacterales bacterium]|nr:hypothetical protein [Desulfobacterales bacterium]
MLDSYAGLIVPADRLGHRHLPVPPVLHDRARRAVRGRTASTAAGPMQLLLRHPAADVAHLHRGPVRDPVHLRLEPVPLAAADHERREALHAADRHQAHAGRGRGPGRVAHHHGLHHPGHAAAGAGGDASCRSSSCEGMTETEK